MVIFDCNGVLVDSEPLATAIVSQEFIRAGFALTPDIVARYFTGRRSADMFAEVENAAAASCRQILPTRWPASPCAGFARSCARPITPAYALSWLRRPEMRGLILIVRSHPCQPRKYGLLRFFSRTCFRRATSTWKAGASTGPRRCGQAPGEPKQVHRDRSAPRCRRPSRRTSKGRSMSAVRPWPCRSTAIPGDRRPAREVGPNISPEPSPPCSRIIGRPGRGSRHRGEAVHVGVSAGALRPRWSSRWQSWGASSGRVLLTIPIGPGLGPATLRSVVARRRRQESNPWGYAGPSSG